VKAPLLIFSMTALAMIILAISRRKHFFSGIMAGIFSVVIAIFILYIPLDEALSVFNLSIRFDGRWQLLGRSFLLNQNNRASISYIFLAGGFILAGAWTARPIRMYYSIAMGIMGLVAASLLIDPFLFAAIFIELAVIGSALILSSRAAGRSRGGLRLLSIYTLAMLAILLVGWSIDLSDAGVTMQGMDLTLQILLGIGFGILISIPPFHAWLPITAEENHPFTWSVVAIVLHGAALFFIVRFINNFSWLYESEMLFPFIRGIGATMALVSALWSVLQKDLQKMACYALISDLGVMLIAIGLGSQEGFQLAFGLTGARVISVACLSIGLMQIWKITRRSESNDHTTQVTPSTLASAAVLTGLLSLAGFPLTAGFPGRWGLLSLVASLDQYAWISIIGSMGILCIATIRSATLLLFRSSKSYYEMKDWKEIVFIGGGILLTIALGIFPQLLFPWVIKAIEGIFLPV
jgi:formate hydrogenlyase subunit 3/multisubunit Na+/H+ antiporter MnhD subunit